MTEARERRQSLQSLERGIAVIQVFSRERPALTLSEVARLTGITRATARRILLTLEDLGHVRSDGRLFSLTPRVLTLGWAYLSSLGLWETAQPLMEELARRADESCSAATLDLPDIVYVARVPTRRLMTIALEVGTRLPATHVDEPRVLADLSAGELDQYLASVRLDGYTERTIVEPGRLHRTLDQVRVQGWALVDQELRDRPALDRRAAARERSHGRCGQRLGGGAARAAGAAARRVPARPAAHGRADRGRAGAPAARGCCRAGCARCR